MGQKSWWNGWGERLEARRLLAGVVADGSFGENGLFPSDRAEFIVGQRSDGSLLLGPRLEVLKADGTYDQAYRSPSNSYADVGSEAVLDARDRVYLTGLTRTRADTTQLPTINRFLPNGEQDSSLRTTRLSRPGNYRGNPVDYYSAGQPQVDAEGRLLVMTVAEYWRGGSVLNVVYSRIYLERLYLRGGRDLTFGDEGRILLATHPGKTDGFAYPQFTVAPDNKPLVTSFPAGGPVTFTRFMANGTPDASFGPSGQRTVAGTEAVKAARTAIDAQGRITLAYGQPGKSDRLTVRRFTAGGVADVSFSGDGKVSVTSPLFDGTVSFLGIDDAGRTVIGAGSTLVRLTTAGQLDADFGTAGLLPTGEAYLYDTRLTPSAIYARTKVGDVYGLGRFVETNVARLFPASGLLSVTGSNVTDTIRISPATGGVRVRINGPGGTLQYDQTFAGVQRIQIDAMDGNDVVNVSVDHPVGLNLGRGNDTLSGTTGLFTVLGGAGNDLITTGDGADSIEAGEGDDSVFAGNGRDIVINTAGSDQTDLGAGGGIFGRRLWYSQETNNAPQTVTGRGGPNSRYDVLTGNGDDRIAIIGGAVVVTAGGGNNRITALADVAATIVTYDQNDTVITGQGNDRISTAAGEDRISSGGGNDSVLSGLGRDTINGGPGDDEINDAGGNNYVHGDDGNDSIRTGDGADSITGDAGRDTIRSNGGPDVVLGGPDGDLLFGGPSQDFIFGDDGRDRAVPDDDDARFESIEIVLT